MPELHRKWLLKERRWRESRDESLAHLRLGRLIGQNPGSETVFRVAFDTQRRSLEDLGWLAAHRQAPVELLEETLLMLAAPERVALDLELTLLREHPRVRGQVERAVEVELYARGAGARLFLYKPRQTTNSLARLFRDTIDRARQPVYPGRRPVVVGQPIAELLSGNSLGTRCLVEHVAARHENLLTHVYRLECYSGLTQLAIAARIFMRRQGRPPETADDLVPEILPELPRDPFSGGALGYRRRPCLVYSVGVNGLDEGGIGDDPFANLPNLPE